MLMRSLKCEEVVRAMDGWMDSIGIRNTFVFHKALSSRFDSTRTCLRYYSGAASNSVHVPSFYTQHLPQPAHSTTSTFHPPPTTLHFSHTIVPDSSIQPNPHSCQTASSPQNPPVIRMKISSHPPLIPYHTILYNTLPYTPNTRPQN